MIAPNDIHKHAMIFKTSLACVLAIGERLKLESKLEFKFFQLILGYQSTDGFMIAMK